MHMVNRDWHGGEPTGRTPRRYSGCAVMLVIGLGVLLLVGAMVWMIWHEHLPLRH